MKTIYYCEGGWQHSGVDITYIKSRRVLNIGGWYDNIAGIGHVEVNLEDFLRRQGITLRDCERALRDEVG